jgi:hypothetical protein
MSAGRIVRDTHRVQHFKRRARKREQSKYSVHIRFGHFATAQRKPTKHD